MRRHLALPALIAATLLAGCSTPLPTPQPDAAAVTAPPAASTEQVDRVLADIAATLETADAAGDPALLAPRVSGPALTARTVEYALAKGGATAAVTQIPTEAQTVVVPTTDTWPRTVMVVTEQPEDLSPPLLLTLVQDDPRSQYSLRSWSRLFPGVEVPATTQPEVGSPPVDPESTDLAVPPSEVVDQYVDLLTNGDASAAAATFAEDPLRTLIGQTRAAYTQAVGANGTLTETYQAGTEPPVVIGTADGGAIVVDTFQTVTTISLVDSTLTVDPQTATLLGAPTVASSLAITWLSTVAFAVPPAGSEEPVQVIGAEHSRLQVTGA